MTRLALIALLATIAMAQQFHIRTEVLRPTRDPHTPGYVQAKELPDGTLPSPKENGNFIIGPTHNPAREMTVKEGVPRGDVYEFSMESKDSKIYPGIAREKDTWPQVDPADPAKIVVKSGDRKSVV